MIKLPKPTITMLASQILSSRLLLSPVSTHVMRNNILNFTRSASQSAPINNKHSNADQKPTSSARGTTSNAAKSDVPQNAQKHGDQSEATSDSQKEPFVLQQDAGWLTRILKGAGNPQPHAGGGGAPGMGGDSGVIGGMSGGAHSGLGTKKVVYELQFHKIYPDAVGKYIHAYGQLVDHVKQHHGGGERENDFSMQLVGSWLVNTGGDQDQVVNLWKHANGYHAMDSDVKKLNPYNFGGGGGTAGESEGGRLTQEYSRFLRKRQSQYLLAFGFWGDPTTKARQGMNLYEMRSYSLRPGTMVDWASHWARAIHIRKKDSAPVGGFFSQVGHMYKVYHVWSYVDLEDRRQSRDHAWRYPGWDECVQATVPLIKDMQSRLMYATPFSPLQ